MLGGMASGPRPGASPSWYGVMRSVLLSAAVALSLAACAGVPDKPDLFYRPDPLPATARPGDILRSDPLAGAPAGAAAWRIVYVSTDLAGRLLAVSGVGIGPAGTPPMGGRGVVA